jgi:glycosyltransferase involved in cell wall biosynthesis
MLVEIFARLAARRADIALMLVGDGQLRPVLEALVERLGLSGKVILTGGIGHGEVPDYIAAMDICIVPHSNEYRSPIKLFEYMGQARAVLAPRTEPVEMVIRDGETGLLFAPENAAQLEEKLDRLLADESLRQRLGQRARDAVLENHTWDRNAAAVLEAVGR